MIKSGRPDKGYSPYENIFYILKQELGSLYEILNSGLSEINRRYYEKRKEKEVKLKEYSKQVKKLEGIYMIQGIEPVEAHSVASDEAFPILGMYWDLYYDTVENLDSIHKKTVDQLIKSTLISLFSIIEFNLSKIVDLHKNRTAKKTIPFSDSIKELECSYNFKYHENCKEKLESIKFIRNKIVHENSSLLVKGINEKLSQFEGSWEAEGNLFIFKDKMLVDALVKNAKYMFKSILKVIDNIQQYE